LNLGKRIAVDAMGGDGGVSVTVPAAAKALESIPDLTLNLVGNAALMQPYMDMLRPELRERLLITHTDVVIADDDEPGKALRNAKASSMYIAANMVKDGDVQAMVSAGNTGALLMISRHLLKTIEGIQKPAITATIPGASRQNYLLDVGANPECDGQQLFEFAVMGSVLAESLQGQPPRVGLLNIGAETHKGTEEVRQAAELLTACSAINYIGFIEANALFGGDADVVVCDGFVGNMIIKSSAGVATVIKDLLADQIEKSWLIRLSGWSSNSLLSRLSKQIEPHRFNGASLLGLQGIIVKSHGNASSEGFFHAIEHTVAEVEKDVPRLIGKKVAAIMAAS